MLQVLICGVVVEKAGKRPQLQNLHVTLSSPYGLWRSGGRNQNYESERYVIGLRFCPDDQWVDF